MPRWALQPFFERIVVAALPLVCACGGAHPARPDGSAVMAADMAVADLADFIPVVPPVDTCDPAHPPIIIPITLDQLGDGGTDDECRSDGVCDTICTNGYTICCGPNPADGGSITMTCTYNCGPTGRRPAGLAAAAATANDGCGVGEYFAAAAHLEAASVHAFRSLARALRRHGAPARLIARAVTAARDEIRHARVTRALAAQHGARVARVAVTPSAVPSLEALALDNAREGCVRETFGALVAAWQARAAADSDVRAAMADIAVDEAAHAELAWDVDAWVTTKLAAAARARVLAARAAAVAELSAELATPPPPAAVTHAGLPSAAAARHLLREARALWA
jgi:hypothetical protein